MQTLVLGAEPGPLILPLATEGDYEAEMELTDAADVPQPWPDGTTLSLVFASGVSWPATISGAVASWNVDNEIADLRPNTERVKVKYVNGTTQRVLWVGRVQRHG